MSRPFRPKIHPVSFAPVMATVTCSGSTQEVTFPLDIGPGPHCVRSVQKSGTGDLTVRGDAAGQTLDLSRPDAGLTLKAGSIEVLDYENLRTSGNLSIYVEGTSTEVWEFTLGDGI